MTPKTNIYKITDDLVEKGWMYDDTGVYVPYTHKNEEYYDNRNIYLKIERKSSKEVLHYTYVKLEEGLFYPMSHYKSPKLISELDKDLKKSLSNRGIFCGLNGRNGGYIDFVDSFIETINNADCLDILKNSDFTITKEENIVNLTVDKEHNSHHNFMSMANLVMKVTNEIPIEFVDDRYNVHPNPFSKNENEIVKVYRDFLRCPETKKQYDQTEFLMEYYDLDTPQEAEEKFQELLQ